MFKTLSHTHTHIKKAHWSYFFTTILFPDCHLATNGLPVLQVSASHLKKRKKKPQQRKASCSAYPEQQELVNAPVQVDLLDEITHFQLLAPIIILIVNYWKNGRN